MEGFSCVAYVLIAFVALDAFYYVNDIPCCTTCVWLGWVGFFIVGGGYPTFSRNDCAAFTADGFVGYGVVCVWFGDLDGNWVG